MNILAAKREQILQPTTRRFRLKPSKLDKKTRADLAEIEKRIQSFAVSVSNPAKGRGRPCAEQSIDWIASAVSIAIGLSGGWTWEQATIASGLTPTKANKRTVQRRQEQLARLVAAKVRLPFETDF